MHQEFIIKINSIRAIECTYQCTPPLSPSSTGGAIVGGIDSKPFPYPGAFDVLLIVYYSQIPYGYDHSRGFDHGGVFDEN